MKRILVFGESSYVGTAFSNYISRLSNDFSITTLGSRGDEWKAFDFSGFDSLFYVAGIAHSDSGRISPEKAKQYYDVNTRLTINVAAKAKMAGLRQFIFMSSMIVYASSHRIGKEEVINGSTIPMPDNSYGDSKLKAEIALREMEDETFHVAIIRSPMVYGEGCKGNYSLLSKFARYSPIFPYVKNRRSMIYIGNLVVFVKLLINNNESGIFCPQNAEYVDVGEMVKLVAQCHNKRVLLLPIPRLFVSILSRILPILVKIYGSSIYDLALSEYKQDYRLFTLRESIAKTEGTDYVR